MSLNLIYRSSQDGSSLQDIHSKIDGRGPTFVFIKSDRERVFGFFTSVPWQVPEKESKSYTDSQAFLFSLTHKSKHEQFQREDWAVRHFRESHAFVLGGGTDLMIRENFDKRCDNLKGIGLESSTFKAHLAMRAGDSQR